MDRIETVLRVGRSPPPYDSDADSLALNGISASRDLTHWMKQHRMPHIASCMTLKRQIHVNQLTVRGFDTELNASIRRLARREGISLNKAALRLLRKGAELTEGAARGNTVGHSLDHMIGTWTQVESDEMDSALQEFETIDEAAWK